MLLRATLLTGLPMLAALTLTEAACAPPLQSGEVVVFPGAAARLGLLCRFRQSAAKGELCFATEEAEAPVEAVSARLSLPAGAGESTVPGAGVAPDGEPPAPAEVPSGEDAGAGPDDGRGEQGD